MGSIELVAAPQEVVPGSRLQLAAEVENVGTLAGTYLAQLTLDWAVVGRQEASLAAGESKRLVFELVAGPPRMYSIRLGVAHLMLDVLGPADFDQSVPTVTPTPAEVGDPVSISVVVTNRGGLAGSQIVKLSVDRDVVDAREVTLAGRESTTVTFSIPAAKAGTHSITVNGQDAELVVWNIERPANGKVFVNKLRGGEGHLSVDNGTERDALVVLTRPAEGAKSLLAFYVRAGSSRTVKGIKDGTYLVFYRLGQRWDSYSRRFTRDAQNGRFTDKFPFKTTFVSSTIWRVTLQKVFGGNAPSEDVSENDFPALDE